MAMSDFLTYEDCVVNMNTGTIGGRVIRVEPLSSKTSGLSIVVAYRKVWPNGGSQEIPLRAYVTGAERVEKLNWLKAGEWILAHGEMTDRGDLYAHRVEWLSRPAREPGDDDAFLAGALESQAN